jgi:hypothetical protein
MKGRVMVAAAFAQFSTPGLRGSSFESPTGVRGYLRQPAVHAFFNDNRSDPPS